MKLLRNLPKVCVEQLANKNQFVITYEDLQKNIRYLCFQSYDTLIAVYDKAHKQMFINWQMWDYSKTTLKHLKMFVNFYTCFEYETKAQFLNLIRKNDNVLTFEERDTY